jgi:hypothetical protein
MTCNDDDGGQRPKPLTVEFEEQERQRIAERLVQAFREAGYSCEVGYMRTSKREN